MLNVLLTGSLSFIIAFLAIPAIIRVAKEKKLFDVPDSRKLHTKPIASLGGVGVFLGFIISALLSISFGNAEFQYFFAASILIFFLGLKDDILILSANKKFLVQLAVAAIIIHLGNIRIDSLHGIMDIYQVPEPVGIVLTYATIIMIVNAFNLIDGVDGLAGSLGVLTTLVLGTYFFMAAMPAYSLLAFAMTGSLLAFLVFNFNPAKIFMGDSGSLLLGLINSILVIKFIAVADAPGTAFPIHSGVAIGIATLIIPLLDTLRVFSIRLSKGRSPFSPDRNHIHHLLLDRGLNHKSVTFACLALNIFFIAAVYASRNLGSTYLIVGMLALGYALIGALIYLKKPVKKLVIASSFSHAAEPISIATKSKLIAIKNEAAAVEQ
jgi:UDP-N-acetylmuramyl pentapeptide phosphotransferase/UDP-N-acetylglucosamine-1-phosphate transferase